MKVYTVSSVDEVLILVMLLIPFSSSVTAGLLLINWGHWYCLSCGAPPLAKSQWVPHHWGSLEKSHTFHPTINGSVCVAFPVTSYKRFSKPFVFVACQTTTTLLCEIVLDTQLYNQVS